MEEWPTPSVESWLPVNLYINQFIIGALAKEYAWFYSWSQYSEVVALSFRKNKLKIKYYNIFLSKTFRTVRYITLIWVFSAYLMVR